MATAITCSICNDRVEIPGDKNCCKCGSTDIVTDNGLIRIKYNTEIPPSYEIIDDKKHQLPLKNEMTPYAEW